MNEQAVKYLIDTLFEGYGERIFENNTGYMRFNLDDMQSLKKELINRMKEFEYLNPKI